MKFWIRFFYVFAPKPGSIGPLTGIHDFDTHADTEYKMKVPKRGPANAKPVLLVMLAFLVSLCSGCGGDESGTVRIGLIAELTGDIPAVGDSCKKAAEMAVKEMNDAGGIT